VRNDIIPREPASIYATLDNNLLKQALKIALDDAGIDKLRMVCWLIRGVDWNIAVSFAVPTPMYELPPKSIPLEENT